MYTKKESLGFVRIMMAISGFSPLFILWAIKGLPSSFLLIYQDINKIWIGLCLFMIFLPNFILWKRYKSCSVNDDTKTVTVNSYKESSENILAYLFATLFPLFQSQLSSMNDFIALVVAFLVLVFIFIHLNLYYLNIVFAFKGYNTFTIVPGNSDENQHFTKPIILLSKRHSIKIGSELISYRLSDTVYMEKYD